VNKREVYDLARFINRKEEIIPNSIITREPSAELRENQTDAQGMGGRPQDIADLVDVLIEGGEVEDTALSRNLKKLLVSSEWKRRQAPPAIKISRKAFGHGRRVPM
jgi:NAD+ synthase (glutamine-hydrolysing)